MAKALVVTGAPWVRDSVVGALSRNGVEVTTTSDPFEVETLLARVEPEVVITDSQIATMGFVAVSKIVRSEEALGTVGRTGIIALLDRRADVFLARRGGADAWLVKPLNPAALRWTFEVLTHPEAVWSEAALEDELAGTAIAGADIMEAAHEVADETAAADAEFEADAEAPAETEAPAE